MNGGPLEADLESRILKRSEKKRHDTLPQVANATELIVVRKDKAIRVEVMAVAGAKVKVEIEMGEREEVAIVGAQVLQGRAASDLLGERILSEVVFEV